MGVHPNIIVLRCDEPLEESIFNKIALFCNVKKDCVIENVTLPHLYEAPLMLERSRFSEVVCRELGLDARSPDLTEWNKVVERIKNTDKKVRIALVGKYVALHDAYLSVAEALRHAGYFEGAEVEIEWIDSEKVTERDLLGADGIIVPGGFGGRGTEGMIETARYARENGVPYFGICLGMQIAVIEFARNVVGLNGANSREFDPDSPHKVIDFMPGQNDEINKGGTLRLGRYECRVKKGTLLEKCYGKTDFFERHRHRYEFNNEYKETLEKAGLVCSGTSPDGRLVEVVEIKEHPFFIGVQYHPEFKSRPNRPHPVFSGFIKASLAYGERRKNAEQR